MTTTPAGWYPDRLDPAQLRWWDGSEWSSYTKRARPEPTRVVPDHDRPALGRGWFTLSRLVENALRFSVMLSLAYVALDIWGHRMFGSWLAAPELVDQGRAEFFDSLSRWLWIASLVLLVITGTLFITWLFRAHRSDRMYPAQLEYASGWAIGGWFVPILNLWRPPQMVLDVRRGASDAGGASTALVLWWWWVVLGAGLAQRIANNMVPGPGADFRRYVEDLQQHLVVDAIASVLFGVGAILAILVVRSTVRLVRASPHAAVADASGTA